MIKITPVGPVVLCLLTPVFQFSRQLSWGQVGISFITINQLLHLQVCSAVNSRQTDTFQFNRLEFLFESSKKFVQFLRKPFIWIFCSIKFEPGTHTTSLISTLLLRLSFHAPPRRYKFDYQWNLKDSLPYLFPWSVLLLAILFRANIARWSWMSPRL